MTRKEQEKLGKEIVEKLNKGKEISGFNISYFYNIKQFYYIKINFINPREFSLIVLPEDYEGNSLLEVGFIIVTDNFFIRKSTLVFGYYVDNNKFHCFTKFKLTGIFWDTVNLDYWIIVNSNKFEWIIEKLKRDNPEYNLAMYELFGFNEEYIRRELGYFKDICK